MRTRGQKVLQFLVIHLQKCDMVVWNAVLVLRLLCCLRDESSCYCVTSKKDTFIFIILFFSNNIGLRAHTAEMKRGTIPDVSLIGLSTSCLSVFMGGGTVACVMKFVFQREDSKPTFVRFKK